MKILNPNLERYELDKKTVLTVVTQNSLIVALQLLIVFLTQIFILLLIALVVGK